MKISLLFMAAALAATALRAADETPSLADAAKRSPQELFPGYLVRVYNADKEKGLTNIVAVVESGADLKKNYMPAATNYLRGTSDKMDLAAIAEAYIVVDEDTKLYFDIEGNDLFVNRKDFGRGKFVKVMPKGKYPVEISRQAGQGQGNFAITDETGRSFVFYTGQMLNIALGRSYKVGKKTEKSFLLNDVIAAAQTGAPDALPPALEATAAKPIRPKPNGTIVLPAEDAVLNGAVQFNAEKGNLGKWNGVDAGATWRIAGATPGAYDVHLTYALKGKGDGRAFTVSSRTDTIMVTEIEGTADWFDWKVKDLGPIKLDTPDVVFSVVAKAIPGSQGLFNLKDITLTRAK